MATYFLAFWNLENLFAPEGFPEREPWIADRLAGELAGWTEELFARKLDQLTSVIARMNDGRGPDLLGVCEVENRFVLERLGAVLNAALPERRFELVHADATRDHRGIDTAFLYDGNRLGIDPDAIFSHWIMRRTGTRDITQATFGTETGLEFIATLPGPEVLPSAGRPDSTFGWTACSLRPRLGWAGYLDLRRRAPPSSTGGRRASRRTFAGKLEGDSSRAPARRRWSAILH